MILTELAARAKHAALCMTRQCWEQGILAQALLETEDYDSLLLLVKDMVLRQSDDGRLCTIEDTPAVVDSSFCVGATLFAGNMTGDKKIIGAAEKNISYLLSGAPRSQDGILYHMRGTKEIWADTAAFLPSVLAAAGHEDDGVNQIIGVMGRLRDDATGLYFHMWDDSVSAFKRKLLWGVGNGWILTGLLRLSLHVGDRRAEEVAAMFKSLLDAMLEFETPDHLFRDILDDPASFQESECSEMVAYSIYAAAREKLISRDYLERADAIYNAVLKKVGDDGVLRDCASSPDFVRSGTSVEGQAHFLMMVRAAQTIHGG